MLRKVLAGGQVDFPEVETRCNPIAAPLHIGLAVIVPEDRSIIAYEIEEDRVGPPIAVIRPNILGGKNDLRKGINRGD